MSGCRLGVCGETLSFADLVGESKRMTTMDSPVKPANDEGVDSPPPVKPAGFGPANDEGVDSPVKPANDSVIICLDSPVKSANDGVCEMRVLCFGV
jgi:hypothetical protein